MESYREDTYGERIAEIYDEFYAEYDLTAIERLRDLAKGGRALELGIGTGRIALPLQAAGVPVSGVDASIAMVERMRLKPDGENIPISMGNFADVSVDGEYSLIYVLFNTFYALLTQEEQLRCLQNVAVHLTVQGCFVLEGFVPDLSRFNRHQRIQVISLEEGRVRLDASQHDPVRQQITAQHVLLSESGIRFFPVRLRYVWPSELDLMAQLAGLRLQERWGGWDKAPFTANSVKHISVFMLKG